MPLLAHVFEEDEALDRLEAFTSLNGPGFYRLPVNADTVTLRRHERAHSYPDKILTEAGPVTVFDPGFALHWHVES